MSIKNKSIDKELWRMDKISIIIPIYKVENYLERCIESVLSQTYKNIEIVLIDDGSPDNCGLICDNYAEKEQRIRVIHKENGGLSDARNVGIELATGEYLMFVDSDDWIDYDMVEILHKVSVYKKADIVECSYRSIFNDRIEEETNCTADIITGDRIFALEGMLDWKYFKAVAWNKLYHRSVFSDIRYPKGKYHEDEFTTYKYFYNAKRLCYVDVSKYNYDRTRETSITGGGFKESNLDACFALRERIDFFRENNIKKLEKKLNDVYGYVLFDCINKSIDNEIKSEKIEQLVIQAQSDIEYFKNHPINKEYYKKLVLLSKGYKEYMKSYRREKLWLV